MASGFKADAKVPLYARLAVALPAALFAWFGTMVPTVAGGETLVWEIAWLPQRGIALGFVVDGLSLLFALLITGIGSFILLFASEYMRGYPQRGRFTTFLVGFMLAMLGLVLSDNLIALFVFWELTTITSFLLIGYSHEDATARRAALQGLLVTGAGALAMLAGFVLLGEATGTLSLREMLASPGSLAEHPHYLAIVILVFAGAFTKSAQFPFHFWLPNAMAAPTPVSAYLHSATMVKAGVFLLARLTPLLGGTDLWMETLTAVGAVTAVYSSVVALTRTDLKQMLAYTTIMALGTCVMFLGSPIGSEGGQPSVGLLAAMAFVFIHALYKAALFLAAGTIEQSTGTRDISRLGGLRRVMPITFAATTLAAVSMAGVPLTIGFLGKDLLYTAGFLPEALPYVIGAIFAAAVLIAVAALLVTVQPFGGNRPALPRVPHEGHWTLWIGSLALGIVGLFCGLQPQFVFNRLLVPAAASVMGYQPHFEHDPWHGSSAAFWLSLATLATALLIYWQREAVFGGFRRAISRLPLTGDRAYDLSMDGVARIAAWQTRRVQSGIQRRYILVVFATLGLGLAVTLFIKDATRWPTELPQATFLEWSLALLVAASALLTIRARSRLLAICSLGVVGTCTALIFLIFGAPDVAMTQLIVETLVTVLVAMVLLKLPDFRKEVWRSAASRLRDGLVALTVGASTTLVLLAVTAQPPQKALTEYFERTAVPGGFGRNIVNVILVDFRALDTLGEITVLSIAGVAAFALLMPSPRRRVRATNSTNPLAIASQSDGSEGPA